MRILDPKKCGHNFLGQPKNSKRIHKIMNGKDVPEGTHPWAVAFVDDDKGTFCTGTLISTKHVVTAAHCLLDTPCIQVSEANFLKDTWINYGSVCMQDAKNCTAKNAMDTRKITKIFFRTKFFEGNCKKGDDIAVMELDSPIDEKIANYICLPENVDPSNIPLTALGWGLTMNDTDPATTGYILTAKHLQKLDVGYPFIRKVCEKIWQPTLLANNRTLPHDVICVAEFEKKNTCQGDSGGGLVGIHDVQYFLFGVLSFGTPCANLKNAPSQNATKIKKSQIFTRIASHLDEIKGLIKG